MNNQAPSHQENLPATYKAVGHALAAPNIVQRLQNLLPADVKVDRFRSVAMHFLQENPGLVECSANSIVSALMSAAGSGLLPDRVYGHCYIVPFKGQAIFLVGYKGYIKLALNSGLVTEIYADLVYPTDQIEIVKGTEVKINHIPDLKADKTKVMPIAVYAIAFLKGARNPIITIMSYAEVEQIRLKAHSGNSPAWKNNYPEMMRKTAIRRLCKTLPMATMDQASRVAAAEEESERLGASVQIEGDYTHVEQQDGGGGAAGVEADANTNAPSPSGDVPPGATGDAGNALPAQPLKKQQSSRLKQALKDSVEHEKKETPPHDPETGEIIEGEIMSPGDGPDFTVAGEVDTGPVDFTIRGKHPDMDKWASDVASRLDTFTTPQQVNQFEVAVRASKPWVYVSLRSEDAKRHFEDLVSMRKEQLGNG